MIQVRPRAWRRLGTTQLGPQGSSGSALSHLRFDPSQVKDVNMGATGALDALDVSGH